MHAKLAQLRRLLDEGYVIDEIRSDGPTLEAVLVRHGVKATVRLDRTAAEAILFKETWRPRRLVHR